MKPPKDITIARNIRKLMTEKDLMPRDVRRALADFGIKISDSSFSNYITEDEKNNRKPTHDILLGFAKVFNVRFSEIFGNEYAEHDTKVHGLTMCGDLGFRSSFNLGTNLTHHKVTNNENKQFKIGDYLLIDKQINSGALGDYLVVINNISHIVRSEIKNNELIILGKNHDQIVDRNDIKIVGRVVANFKTNL